MVAARSRPSHAVALLVALVALVLPSVAESKGSRPAKAQKSAQSLGTPDDGKLQGGKRIQGSTSLRVVGALQYGLPSLVGMLERSSAKVAKRYPGSILTVGDLSQRGGGDVGGHRSHESGRDADVAFYLRKGDKPFLAKRFAKVGEDGVVVGSPGVRFDDARNWELIASWLSDPEAQVLQIFVARHLRARLLAQAANAGASVALRNRAAEVLIQPRKALPHDNHFHVRIACPRGSDECVNFAKKKASPAPKRRKVSLKGMHRKK